MSKKRDYTAKYCPEGFTIYQPLDSWNCRSVDCHRKNCFPEKKV